MSKNKDEVKVRVLTEKLFIAFDLQADEKELNDLILAIEKENIKLLPADAHSFYISILAVIDMRAKKYSEADMKLNAAIELLKKEEPKHLPNIYRKKIAIYNAMDDPKKALEAFKNGLYYAKKYKVDLYEIVMYEEITKFYNERQDYRNAHKFQKIVSEKHSKYNASNTSGELTILEKQALEEKFKWHLDIRKIIFFTSITVFVFGIFFYRKYRLNKKVNQMERLKNYLHTPPFVKEKTVGNETLKNLTHRQLEIVCLVNRGLTNKEIGQQLFISENTVKYHLKLIYSSLGIENRWELKYIDLELMKN
jgi:DNA-binding CsgD family transcriptional regulator